MAENIVTKEDLRKLATKEELRESLKDVVRKKDIQKLETKPGLKNWLNVNWAGVVVSFIALVTAIYSGCESRKHDRLSVRPHITLSFNANDKGAGWIRTINGPGPVIINAFEVAVDGKPVETWDAVLVALGIDPRVINAKLAIPTPGTYLLPSGGADATRPLLWVESPPAARAALVKGSDRVQLRLVYCSLYDECWERSTLAAQLEPTPVAKRKPILAFGMSQLWRDGFSETK